MITINDIKRRIEYVEKILALYEGEKEALQSLSTIYSNVAYQDVRALEELVKQNTPTGMMHMEVAKPESQSRPMNRSLSPVAKMLASKSYKNLLEYIYIKKENDIILLPIDAACAKEIGIGSGSLGKLRDMMLATGRLSKTADRKYYRVSASLLEELKRLERYGM